jgi:NADPH:quinone reductase-like Zn-dependent oxidoreductase
MKEAMTWNSGINSRYVRTKLTETVQPEDGIIVVSGATGGVGALSVSILKLGYSCCNNRKRNSS